MIDKQLLQKRFSANAKTYDQFANVQKKMADRLLKQLVMKRNDSSPLHILEIGCGTGYLTAKLSRHFKNATITAVDLAPGMIEIAKQRISEERIHFLCGDIEEMELYDRYDLIISNATFQWLNHFESTLFRLSSILKRDGMILFSTFGCGTFHELHTSFQRAMQKLQLDTNVRISQPFYALEDLLELCERSVQPVHPFSTIFGTEMIEIERFHSVKDFITSLRKIGATNSNAGPYFQRPSVLKEMMNIYEQDFQERGHIIATYHCLFIGIEC
ncbi:malonyl-[acyl-carrier protein] O-methyltransferase BioC [Bacillus methanolicus]|uniref:malonyl-ACP O-methyltransferase BioC n=1 Tax=Bacillus methanolicus TaxID=1471 RepID=UPI0023807BEA|nr:malonyl-ACP O-methyltransferase BioC [Bacillus methanolicus]MDE3839175.1 malonyl-[acyl-carrier protein] O-methyltransferase BioC [Bacillus methanolicus]